MSQTRVAHVSFSDRICETSLMEGCAMGEPSPFERMEQMLAEGSPISDLLRRSSRSCLSWDEFLTCRLPAEMSPLETWQLLKLLNHTAGIDLPIPDLEGN